MYSSRAKRPYIESTDANYDDESDDVNFLYYNANIIGDSNNRLSLLPSPAVYSEVRSVPILKDTSGWNLAVARLATSGSTSQLPLLVPQLRARGVTVPVGTTAPTSLTTTYNVGLSVTVSPQSSLSPNNTVAGGAGEISANSTPSLGYWGSVNPYRASYLGDSGHTYITISQNFWTGDGAATGDILLDLPPPAYTTGGFGGWINGVSGFQAMIDAACAIYNNGASRPYNAKGNITLTLNAASDNESFTLTLTNSSPNFLGTKAIFSSTSPAYSIDGTLLARFGGTFNTLPLTPIITGGPSVTQCTMGPFARASSYSGGSFRALPTSTIVFNGTTTGTVTFAAAGVITFTQAGRVNPYGSGPYQAVLTATWTGPLTYTNQYIITDSGGRYGVVSNNGDGTVTVFPAFAGPPYAAGSLVIGVNSTWNYVANILAGSTYAVTITGTPPINGTVVTNVGGGTFVTGTYTATPSPSLGIASIQNSGYIVAATAMPYSTAGYAAVFDGTTANLCSWSTAPAVGSSFGLGSDTVIVVSTSGSGGLNSTLVGRRLGGGSTAPYATPFTVTATPPIVTNTAFNVYVTDGTTNPNIGTVIPLPSEASVGGPQTAVNAVVTAITASSAGSFTVNSVSGLLTFPRAATLPGSNIGYTWTPIGSGPTDISNGYSFTVGTTICTVVGFSGGTATFVTQSSVAPYTAGVTVSIPAPPPPPASPTTYLMYPWFVSGGGQIGVTVTGGNPTVGQNVTILGTTCTVSAFTPAIVGPPAYSASMELTFTGGTLATGNTSWSYGGSSGNYALTLNLGPGNAFLTSGGLYPYTNAIAPGPAYYQLKPVQYESIPVMNGNREQWTFRYLGQVSMPTDILPESDFTFLMSWKADKIGPTANGQFCVSYVAPGGTFSYGNSDGAFDIVGSGSYTTQGPTSYNSVSTPISNLNREFAVRHTSARPVQPGGILYLFYRGRPIGDSDYSDTNYVSAPMGVNVASITYFQGNTSASRTFTSSRPVTIVPQNIKHPTWINSYDYFARLVTDAYTDCAADIEQQLLQVYVPVSGAPTNKSLRYNPPRVGYDASTGRFSMYMDPDAIAGSDVRYQLPYNIYETAWNKDVPGLNWGNTSFYTPAFNFSNGNMWPAGQNLLYAGPLGTYVVGGTNIGSYEESWHVGMNASLASILAFPFTTVSYADADVDTGLSNIVSWSGGVVSSFVTQSPGDRTATPTPIAPGATTFSVVRLQQEYVTTSGWCPFVGMAITSNSLSAQFETSGTTLVKSGVTPAPYVGNITNPILFDLDFATASADSLLQGVTYAPTVYRWVQLNGGPLSDISFSVWLKLRDGTLVPWDIPSMGSIDIKLLFARSKVTASV